MIIIPSKYENQATTTGHYLTVADDRCLSSFHDKPRGARTAGPSRLVQPFKHSFTVINVAGHIPLFVNSGVILPIIAKVNG